jgi:DNA-binding beta-propeller fold protein YncE
MATLVHIALANLSSLILAASAPTPDSVKVTYLHSLSTSFGTVPLDAVTLSYDREHHEIFVTGDGPARVYNESGMEVFIFDDDPNIGRIRSVATREDGDLLVLSTLESGAALIRCTFRGEFISRLELSGVPAGFAGANYSVMRQQGGQLYLADLNAMKVLVVDGEGTYVASWDLAPLLEVGEQREDYGLRGFNVDKDGNILFTVQALFKAFVLSPAGDLRAFGTRGGAPGKFNVVSGIARDDAGNFYVADILKSVVNVFDPEFRFVREFGYRGRGPHNLAAPEDLAVADGKLFVSQHARKGVSVFQVVQQ